MKKHTTLSITSLILATVLYLPIAWAAGEPENVSGVSAVSTSPDSVTLTWDAARDTDEETGEATNPVANYNIYYGTESVFGGAPFYENELKTPNNNASFIITGLEADTTYYFSITSLDGEGNESIEYSVETSVKTQGGSEAQDSVAPVVVNATALSSTQVLMRFSEAVELPSSPELAFTIAEQINPVNTLDVLNAVIYDKDPTGETVLLETNEQSNGTDYIVTASAQIKDKEGGNPIESGATDSALFEGSDEPAEEETPNENEAGQEQENESNENSDTDGEPVNCGIYNENLADSTESTKVCFENSFESCSAATFVKVVGSGDTQENYQYEIIGESDAENGSCEVKSNYLKHPNSEWVDQEMTCFYDSNNAFEDEEIAAIADLENANCSGPLHDLMTRETSENNETDTDTEEESPEEDTTPPENVTNLTAQFTQMAEKFMVALTWTPSLDSAQDLVDQILYQRTEASSEYDQGRSLGANATSYDVDNLTGGTEYHFKLTTKDVAGNESTGAIRSIRLPQTGFGTGFLMLGSALGARQLLRRRRKK